MTNDIKRLFATQSDISRKAEELVARHKRKRARVIVRDLQKALPSPIDRFYWSRVERQLTQ